MFDEDMKERVDFADVLRNCDDQVIVRELLIELVPRETKWKIVDRFNAHVREWNARAVRLRKIKSRDDLS